MTAASCESFLRARTSAGFVSHLTITWTRGGLNDSDPHSESGKRPITCSGHRVHGGGDASWPDTRAWALTPAGAESSGAQTPRVAKGRAEGRAAGGPSRLQLLPPPFPAPSPSTDPSIAKKPCRWMTRARKLWFRS